MLTLPLAYFCLLSHRALAWYAACLNRPIDCVPWQILPLVPQGTGLVRRLFDREPDNQHEEPLLIAQLAAMQLRAHLTPPTPRPHTAGPDTRPRLAAAAPWLRAVSDRLGQAAAALTQLQQAAGGRAGWVGGLVNHPDTFPCLYQLLLVFWVVGPQAADHIAAAAGAELTLSQLAARVQAGVQAVCCAGLSGPMLSLVKEVAQQWDIQVGSGDGQEAGAGAGAAPVAADVAAASPWGALFLLDEGRLLAGSS